MTLRLNDRLLLLDALRPPDGMELDAALGTTFTLDLIALLSIPIAALIRADGLASTRQDAADIVESVRRHSERTLLYCQAGAISVPSRYRPAFAFIERTVVPVRPNAGHIFHPKMWALRFAASDGTQHHRILVASRNLTFDRSWDVVGQFDEDLDAERACDTSGLIEFMQKLKGTAVRTLAPVQDKLHESLVNSIGKARFAVPEGFTEAKFWPLGIADSGWPFEPGCDNVLAVSPFLGSETAHRLVSTGRRWSGVISRPASLDAARSGLTGAHTFRMNLVLDALNLITEDDASDETEPAAGDFLTGLHAKLYIQDVEERSTVVFGSANLTRAAFGGNAEMLVRLVGPTSSVGIDATVKWNEKSNLGHLIEPHTLASPESADDEETLDSLTGMGFGLAAAPATLRATVIGQELYDLELQLVIVPPQATVKLEVRPLSIKDQWRSISGGAAVWHSVALTRLTPFIVVRLTGADSIRQLIIPVPIEGDPPNRRDAVLASCINSRDDFMRYLMALFGADGGPSNASGDDTGGDWSMLVRTDRILEDLLTTASRNPSRLESLTGTLEELKKTPQGIAVVPVDFLQIWDSVQQALLKGASA